MSSGRPNSVASTAFDAADCASLAGSPEVRAIVVDHYVEAVNLSNACRHTPPHVGYPTTPIPSLACQRAAENVTAEGAMSADRLGAAVSVLDVFGLWSHITAPGDMLSSVEFAQGHDAVQDAVRRAFGSRWDGPQS